MVDLFNYAVFKRNDYSGQTVGVDWCAVDVLLIRENITVAPAAFKDFRMALVGYIDVFNEDVVLQQKQ